MQLQSITSTVIRPTRTRFDISAARNMGVDDAVAAEAFCPEALFSAGVLMAAYTLGFLAVQPDNPAAVAWLERFIGQPAPEAIDDALLEQQIARDEYAAVRESVGV